MADCALPVVDVTYILCTTSERFLGRMMNHTLCGLPAGVSAMYSGRAPHVAQDRVDYSFVPKRNTRPIPNPAAKPAPKGKLVQLFQVGTHLERVI
jgi:hypothetical protein|mmetsp:Transcript_50060/g.81831  ORF Transcript_50060/g.81831 Transcript_50060/m.81831 type:complete len:95 (+) Transcript_50060:984-1268(+)